MANSTKKNQLRQLINAASRADAKRSSSPLPEYTVDTRPLCQGSPFLLTDAAHPRIVLKQGSHFLVLDESGLIPACNTLGYGYYRYDTRHISAWEFALNDAPLSLLSRSTEKGFCGNFLYTNTQVGDLAQQKIIVNREMVLAERYWERISFENFNHHPMTIDFKIKFLSDFADMFEVRGLNLPRRGLRMVPLAGDDGTTLFLAYKGVDGVLVETIVGFSGMKPFAINEGEVTFRIDLPVHELKELNLCLTTRWAGQVVASNPCKTNFSKAQLYAEQQYRQWLDDGASIDTSEELVNISLERSLRDLYILRQPTPKGSGLSAGIPWYCAVFGRDSAITAWQTLPFIPGIARESIQVLAAYQGSKDDDFSEERPGKIMHELRLGELARSQQIPHSPYYGTVDATQLWLYVFCQYIFWTGDLEFAQQLWPNVKHALNYLDDATKGGYIYYERTGSQGLINQGWKDSDDSVMHTNGKLAEPPIAICEAQAYLYICRKEVARIAQLLGHHGLAEKLLQQSEALKQMFQRDFWMDEQNYLALALDGQGNQVKSIASNAGHCLFSGILDDEKANLVADRIIRSALHSGWGVRTLSKETSGYSPISYHNGSIWPHDNAIIAEGLRKIGRIHDAHEILKSLQMVAKYEPDFRLPELFCGFDRKDSYSPIDYPVSCSPQAWAAGAIFQLLKSCFNFQPDAINNSLSIIEPSLPDWLTKVTIRGLKLGKSSLDLSFNTSGGSTYCQILKKTGDVKVIIQS